MNPYNYYSCSSWNYGSYAPTNPCFKQQLEYLNTSNQNRYILPQNNNAYNKFGKRILPEEERIVTNEYMQEINHKKKMERSKDAFRVKSAQTIKQNNTIKENNKSDNPQNENENNEQNNNNNNNNNNANVNIKTDTNNYKFRLTYEEWLEVKNKQQMIFNQIKKIKEEEDI